jgi:nitrogen fixation NifU-like protein
MYSARLLDHFQNPRNAGDLPDGNAVAEIENPVCGDVIRISLNMRSGRIAQIRFKARGCVPAMACGSALTELVHGKTTNEARAIPLEQLVAAVGGLPPASAHAAQLALEVLAKALRQLESLQKPASSQGN